MSEEKMMGIKKKKGDAFASPVSLIFGSALQL